MELLVLGGGGFLGFHVVAEALAAGHAVTVLSRSGSPPMDGVEAVEGDRQGDLSALEGPRTWDAVLDTFSEPEAIGRTARLLTGRAGVYGFVSGMSVYHPDGPAVPDEDAPVRRFGELRADPLQARSEAKLGGETAVRGGFEDGPVLVVRPGIMVGPRDPSDRFTSWPARMVVAMQDGRRSLVAPGDPQRPVQYTDARDLAAWIVRMLRDRTGGLFNAVGPGREEPLGAVLDACRQAAREASGPAETELALAWVREADLAAVLVDVEEEARPLWFPEPQIPQAAIDSTRAVAAGLHFRPALQTARETLAWWGTEGRDRTLRAGLPPDVEAGLLAVA